MEEKVYSCNYPIWHELDMPDNEQKTEYYIWLGDTQIYNGQVFRYGTDNILKIDISEICREYLDTFYEAMPINGATALSVPADGLLASIHTFRVKCDYNAGLDENEMASYVVVYDYNTEYDWKLPEKRCLNDPIDLRADPRQLVFINGYNLTEGITEQRYTYQVNGGAVNSFPISAGPNSVFHSLAVPLDDLGVMEGDKVTLSMADMADGAHTYTVVGSCANRYVLYYVNKYGGMDSLLMSGKSTESWKADHTDVKLYHNRIDRKGWEQKRIHSDITRKWELNTGLLTSGNAAKIDHLIYSPKVLLQDLSKDKLTLTTVLVENATFSVKQRPYDMPQYTITVKESQKQQRR